MAVRNPPNSDFKYTPEFEVNEGVKKAFDVNGYILLRGLFSPEEVGRLRTALEDDNGVMTRQYVGQARDNTNMRISLWNQPGDDITGIVARSQKLAGTFGKLLGGEVYHYHAKVINKAARTGGAHLWHQDYGYWYENGCVFPHMGTAWIAIDKADKGNGCLQVLEGSQRAGRVTHYRNGDQVEAHDERVKQLEKFCPRRYIDVEPGDCLLFHCNVIHRSDKNDSDRRRLSYLVAYNRADNDPVYKHHHSQYIPLKTVADSELMECPLVGNLDEKDFFVGIGDDDSHVALNNIQKKPMSN